MEGQAANNAAQNNTGAGNGDGGQQSNSQQSQGNQQQQHGTMLTGQQQSQQGQQGEGNQQGSQQQQSQQQGQGDNQGQQQGQQQQGEGNQQQQQGAPEKYEAFKLPEGMQYNDQAAGKFGEIAKKYNLSQGAAQELVDMYAAEMQATQQKQYDAWMQQRDQWVDQVKKDPEIGGAKMDQSLAVAKRGLMAFGSPELNELLVNYGIGDHPAVVKAFYKAGLTVREDGFSEGRSGLSGDKSIGELFYPDMKK